MVTFVKKLYAQIIFKLFFLQSEVLRVKTGFFLEKDTLYDDGLPLSMEMFQRNSAKGKIIMIESRSVATRRWGKGQGTHQGSGTQRI